MEKVCKKFKTMYNILIIVLLLLSATPAIASSLVIEDFEGLESGRFPSDWRTWPFQRKKATQVYSVTNKDGDNALYAMDDKGLSIQIFRNFYWDADKYPILRWSWYAHILPKGGNETNPATNDSACGVYIVFGGGRGKALKYTWSTLAPPGTVYEKKPGKIYIIAKRSGNPGQWHHETVDVKKEYLKYFGRELDRNPSGVAILTDGNATQSPSACYYDDFIIEAN